MRAMNATMGRPRSLDKRHTVALTQTEYTKLNKDQLTVLTNVFDLP